MNGTNLVVLIGTVGKDPETRTVKTAKGETKVASFSLATNKKRGEKEETQWHNIEVWGPVAEITEKYVSKGKNLYLRGELKYENYEKDGVKKSFTKIVVEELNFLDKKGDSTSAATASSSDSISVTSSETKQAEQKVAAYTNSTSVPYDDGDLPF